MPRAVPLVLAAVIAACQSDSFIPDLPEPSPQPDAALQMSARIDGRVYVASDPGGFPVQHIEVNKGGIRLDATVQRESASGAAVSRVDYELTVAGSPDGGPLPERVVYSRVDAFSGTLYWIAPGQSVELWVGVYHVPDGRHILGPWPITVQRRSHGDDGGGPADGL